MENKNTPELSAENEPMTKDDMMLLMHDMCSRVPYGVVVNTLFGDFTLTGVYRSWYMGSCSLRMTTDCVDLRDCAVAGDCGETRPDPGKHNDIPVTGGTRPYLIPLESMSDARRAEYTRLAADTGSPWLLTAWLERNFYDFNGLVGKGLALPATEEMYARFKSMSAQNA